MISCLPGYNPQKELIYDHVSTLYIFDEKKRFHGTKGFYRGVEPCIDFITFTWIYVW